jgi:beta-glucosidase
MTKLPLSTAYACLLAALLAPACINAEDSLDARADAILARMTVEEKIGQLHQDYDGNLSDADVRKGLVGSYLNIMDPKEIDRIQKVAVEESRLHIPLIFGRDVIHGFRTVFPIPLAQACTWDPDMVRQAAAVAASETAAVGYNWTFSPMVDIARDPRWGRIAEGYGEDPYLSSAMTVATVEGYQTPQDGVPYGIAACVKHFAGYGAAVGGRDYAETPIPMRELRDVYLVPYEAGAKAGAMTFMCAFNDLDGVPCSGSHFLLTDVLRDEWGFKGFVVSDWKSVVEMENHGFAADSREAAKRAINAGVDMEMVSATYTDNLKSLLAKGDVTSATLDERVRNILRVKLELGLFEHPYRVPGREGVILSPAHKELAYKTALESAVLLKNSGNLLPLKAGTKVAVVGPLADAPHEQIGTWAPDGRDEDSVTPLAALRAKLGDANVFYAQGLEYSRDTSRKGFDAAVAAAKKADVILYFAGEESLLSGEAHCLAEVKLPGAQEDLARKLASTGKPVVLILITGRPVVIAPFVDKMKAVMAAFDQGTMAGPALADLLFGDVSPSGRLPVSWPASVGQVPIYYNHKNTGRPPQPKEFTPIGDIPRHQKQTSMGFTASYLDVPAFPAYPFGYGLTYGNFKYSDLSIDKAEIAADGSLTASATILNKGHRAATEVVQLYVRDVVGSVTRPVRELKGFQRVTLAPGESRKVTFTLKAADLAFTNIDMKKVVEPGEFELWIAPDAASGLKGSFRVK